MKTKCKKPAPCKCRACGTKEKLRRAGRRIYSNISHVLGLCGGCVAKEAGL